MSDAEDIFVKPERGAQMTRLETFTDAAFAFAVTLLAISIDQIPTSYPELVETLKGAPAFIASFALLVLYWRAHQVWSHQYGLEDLPSVLLTAALVCLVLIYVYPMKILFSFAFGSMSGGWFPHNFELESIYEFRALATIYAAGFLLMNVSISSLYLHAWRKREELQMSARERFETMGEAMAWLIISVMAMVSIVLVWSLPDRWVSAATWVYVLLFFFSPIYSKILDRIRSKKLGSAAV